MTRSDDARRLWRHVSWMRFAALAVMAILIAANAALAQTLPSNASEALTRGESAMQEALATYPAQFPDRPLWQAAFREGRTAVELAPGHPAPLAFLAEAYSRSNWHGPAVSTWQQFFAAGGEPTAEQAELFAHSAHENAFAAYQAGDLGRAAELYALVANYVPNDVEAHRWLGRIMLETRRPQQAVAAWRTVLELDPTAEGAEYFLELAQAQTRWGIEAANDFFAGVRHYEEGNLSLARNSFAAATVRNADYPQAWGWLGRVYFEQGFYEDAHAAYARALELEPTNANYEWFTRESLRLSQPEPQVPEEPSDED